MLPWSWMVINMGQNNNNSWSSAHYHLRIQTSNMLTWQLWSFVDNINSISDLTSVLTALLQAAMRGLQNIGHALVQLYVSICTAKVYLRQVRAMSSHSQSLTTIGVPWLLLLYKVHVRRYWLRYTTNMTNNDFPTPSLILFLSLASKFCCRLWYRIGKYKVVFWKEKIIETCLSDQMSRAGISVSLGLLSAIIVGILPQSAISFKQLAK